ncbi:hypothetical protein EJ06DRAFT_27230 [Trichodelitschia bisporula]|uniref:Velvet domain-containing protein n=1 Tax=Trichodelitschia bisporula TaxID=703511 RepID=A0A6G1IBQ3_9PEZI|nr:hypothetical protein EJ06DRAFT_27230 [Trichodelitschia bisporula]
MQSRRDAHIPMPALLNEIPSQDYNLSSGSPSNSLIQHGSQAGHISQHSPHQPPQLSHQSHMALAPQNHQQMPPQGHSMMGQQVPQQHQPHQHHQQAPQQQQSPQYLQQSPTQVVQQVQTGNPPRNLDGVSFRRGNRIYSITVVQQPVRARMCGFGDKDRRPITPPPCVRLFVHDAETGQVVDATDVDSTYFVLTVDLWNESGTSEVNLVRHSGNTPVVSISASTTLAFPPPMERQVLGMLATVPYYPTQDMYQTMYQPHVVQQQYRPYMAQPQQQPLPQQSHHPQSAQQQQPPPPPQMQMVPSFMHAAPMSPMLAPPAAGMFTRNLIGSLTVNASRLNDTDGQLGFWFVLSDLSVRTEGLFRLKCNFVDVGDQEKPTDLNTGKAPVLATCYSETFQVYSAKKFPGVIESTPLSKKFASQGIKIPIRKDGPKGIPNQEEFEADD